MLVCHGITSPLAQLCCSQVPSAAQRPSKCISQSHSCGSVEWLRRVRAASCSKALFEKQGCKGGGGRGLTPSLADAGTSSYRRPRLDSARSIILAGRGGGVGGCAGSGGLAAAVPDIWISCTTLTQILEAMQLSRCTVDYSSMMVQPTCHWHRLTNLAW